jgi:photosynthetic reaction center H subunit
MEKGAITAYIDVAQVTLYAFWIFFAGLIIYLRREDKREGYPLVSDRSDRITVQGFPAVPAPKTFYLENGTTVQAPRGYRDDRPIAAKPAAPWPGAPLVPTGNPLVDAVGPASYAERADEPEITWDGLPLIYPLRELAGTTVAEEDLDPRGLPVVGADRRLAGVVKDLWIDRSEPQVRYLEIELSGADKARKLVPMTLARVNEETKQITVQTLLASQFADAPSIARDDRITKLEEDRITGYFGGGQLYATPDRLGPLL